MTHGTGCDIRYVEILSCWVLEVIFAQYLVLVSRCIRTPAKQVKTLYSVSYGTVNKLAVMQGVTR